MIDLSNVYKSYKQRLISIDSRNSSFFLSKLLAKRHIDLIKLAQQLNQNTGFKEGLLVSSEIYFSKLEFDKNKLVDVFINHNEDYQDLVKSIIPTFKESDFDRFKTLHDKRNPDIKFEAFIKELIARYESDSLKLVQQFSRLDKQSKMIERDLGKNDLYLGFPFIEGQFQNGKNFRGPLVLHRVEISDHSDSVKITVNKEGKLINPVFLLSYLNENGKDCKRFDFEISDDVENYIDYAIDFLKSNNISIKYSSKEFEIIESITKSEYKNKYFNEINKFDIKYYCVVGLFPISSRSIYDDLDFLDKNPEKTSKTLNNFLNGSKSFENEFDNTTLKESQIKYISPIDWSQRIVIKNALERDLIIEGPPGTGKSQTIVNIIINLLLQNKKILVVSEKLAAIEVVYNRLGKLRENTLIIKDYIRNKEDFFHQILGTRSTLINIDDFEYDKNNDYIIDEYIDNLKKINRKDYYGGRNFNEFISFIKEKRKYPISLEQKAAIKKLIEKYESLNMNLREVKSKLIYLVSDTSYQKKKCFDSVMNSEISKQLGSKGISFFINHNINEYSIEHIQYNFFLYKANKLLIGKYGGEYFTSGISSRQFNFVAFEEYIQLLNNKINLYKEELLTISDPIYQELELNKKKVEVALEWPKLSEKEKYTRVKQISQSGYKKSFFERIFKKSVLLSKEEESFIEYLDNYSGVLNLKQIGDLFDNMLITDIVIGREYLSRNHTTIEELCGMLLNSDIVKFKDITFNKAQELFNKLTSNIDISTYEEIAKLSDEEKDVIELCNNLPINDSFEDCIEFIKIDDDLVKDFEKTENYLAEFNIKYLNVKESLNNKYGESSKVVYNYVKKEINHSLIHNNALYNEYNGLIGQAELKRRKSMKTIFDRYHKAIVAFFPVILMTPEVISTVFKMQENLFDYVIFDEASQMFVERAIPAIYRASRVIVAGDSKQLKPSSTFQARLVETDELDEDDSVSNAELEALDKESLLEMAKEKYTNRMIQFHYRSEYEELIEFSSVAFYERRLFFASMISNEKMRKPIEIIKVKDGLWTTENTNPAEAEEVVGLVKLLLEKRKCKETIGIITFNIKQKELIQDLLIEANNKLINNELNRVNSTTGDDESLFVKNIENVQGDERDIIIFSIGYARNKDGRVRAQFGLLNQTGGENRLNVAITRAKKKIYVVKSIESQELQVNELVPGPLRLKQYLHFVELVNDKKNDERLTLLNSIHESNSIINENTKSYDSQFKQDVFAEISKIIPDNIVTRKQVNVGGFVMDIALYDKTFNKYIFGIKCDGYQYQSKSNDVERDFHRQLYLESRGWHIHRIINTNWLKDKAKEIICVKTLIENIIRDK